MAQQTEHKTRIKATARVLVYGEGKKPNVDEPDEIIQGKEHILQYEPSLNRWRDEKTGRFTKSIKGVKHYGLDKRSV